MGSNVEPDLWGLVEAVHRSSVHGFHKETEPVVELIAGVGVAGDAHAGATVQHRSRARADPDLPNLRQVHLIHGELHDELRAGGFEVHPGELGENLTTRGIDLLSLPVGTVLLLGDRALVALTGLRNPCTQLDRFQDGLREALVERTADGSLVRKAGVMGVVLHGGSVRAGDPIEARQPPGPPIPLAPV